MIRVNVNTTDATTGATALLLPAQNSRTDPCACVRPCKAPVSVPAPPPVTEGDTRREEGDTPRGASLLQLGFRARCSRVFANLSALFSDANEHLSGTAEAIIHSQCL